MSSPTMQIASPRLPRWAPGLVGAMAAALAGLPAILAGWGVVAWLLAALAVFLVAMPLWSRLVEGRRAAVDRFVTTLVWVLLRLRRVALGLAALGGHRQRAARRSTWTS